MPCTARVGRIKRNNPGVEILRHAAQPARELIQIRHRVQLQDERSSFKSLPDNVRFPLAAPPRRTHSSAIASHARNQRARCSEVAILAGSGLINDAAAADSLAHSGANETRSAGTYASQLHTWPQRGSIVRP